jgi:hypothetical protein
MHLVLLVLTNFFKIKFKKRDKKVNYLIKIYSFINTFSLPWNLSQMNILKGIK